MIPYSDIRLVNTGSDNGWLPTGTKSLPEPMFTNNQWSFVVFTWGSNFTRNVQLSFLDVLLKITYLRLQLHLPGTNELTDSTLDVKIFADNKPKNIHIPDSKVHGANMGPTWVLSAPDGSHVGPMNFAIRNGVHFVLIGYELWRHDVEMLCTLLTPVTCVELTHPIQWVSNAVLWRYWPELPVILDMTLRGLFY